MFSTLTLNSANVLVYSANIATRILCVVEMSADFFFRVEVGASRALFPKARHQPSLVPRCIIIRESFSNVNTPLHLQG